MVFPTVGNQPRNPRVKSAMQESLSYPPALHLMLRNALVPSPKARRKKLFVPLVWDWLAWHPLDFHVTPPSQALTEPIPWGDGT